MLYEVITTIHDMVAEGDKVAVRITSNGTHLGDFQAISATGKPYTQHAIVIYRLTNGKIVEGRLQTVITSYSIHYTKLYEVFQSRVCPASRLCSYRWR